MSDFLIDMIKLYNENVDFNDILAYKNIIKYTKKIITQKNSDLGYEKEHRLIWPNLYENKKFKPWHCSILDDVKPKAIYVGENCSRKNKLLLYTIAKSKGVKLYKMSTINNKTEYSLNYDEITEKVRDSAIEDNIFGLDDYLKDLSKKIKALTDPLVKSLEKFANDPVIKKLSETMESTKLNEKHAISEDLRGKLSANANESKK